MSRSDGEQFPAPFIDHRRGALSPLGGIVAAGAISGGQRVPTSGMRTMGHHVLVYLWGGKGTYADASGQAREVSSGDLLLLFPGFPHTYGPQPGEAWNELFLAVKGTIIESWESSGLLSRSRPILRLSPVQYWLRRLLSVLGPKERLGWDPPLVGLCRLQLVLAEGIAANSGAERDWVRHACALMQDHRELPLPQIAQHLHMSYDQFRKRFRAAVGTSPVQFRRSSVIDRACELMQTKDWSDKEIANHLGFPNLAYFSRCFKQITGRCPTAFRKSSPA